MRFITILCMIFFLLICLLAAIVKGQLMCGREVRNETCADNKCCSQHGYCGITEEYCSISYNCQSNCKIGRNNTSTKDPPMCGREVRNETCADNKCCSQHGFCGTTEDYCLTSYNCQSNCRIGRYNTSTQDPPMCGREVRNVTCKDNMCCSQYGFCGTTEDYCSTSKNCQSNCKFGGSDEDPIFQSCGDGVSANYTSGSQFESNLINLLLPSLVSNGSVNGFFNASTSFGKGTDTIYGLAQCRGDISMEVCKTCLNASTTDIIRVCPNKKDALVHPGRCLLRYSNIRFFSQLESLEDKDTYSFIWPSNTKLSNRVVFSKQLESLMKRLMENASSNPSRFMTGSISTKIDGLSKIYGLVQCIEDLSSSDCLTCLRVMFDRIKIERKGAWVLTSSCQIRYRDFMFFSPSSSPSASSPPASSPPALSPPSDAKRGDNNGSSSSSSSLKIAAIAIPTSVGGGVLLLVFVCIFFIKWKTNRKSTTAGSGNIIGDAEPLQFDLVTIKIATENFSDANKLGEGGFGVVYKGELLDGQEIAVKRLSNKAGQGSQEFKNEVVLLHNLQHRNLVKLLGYCYLEAEEAILIYEYVPNRSLDHFLFDPSEKRHLDWQTRYKIIGGVARGLVYLHEDSRLKIIHRDLKAGNILLDAEMNAKIADFGLAKLVGVDQTQVNASRIAGTYGYMAPEYALHGIFSVKSDVFSFGVLLLEIVSGQKISKFHDQLNQPQHLLSYAWKHWRKGTTLEMMDSTLMDKFSRDEVMRCIHIALLCVQDNIEERPMMSSVVLMLSSYSLTLQSPSEPAFCYSKTISVMFQGVQTQTSSLLNTKPS